PSRDLLPALDQSQLLEQVQVVAHAVGGGDPEGPAYFSNRRRKAPVTMKLLDEREDLARSSIAHVALVTLEVHASGPGTGRMLVHTRAGRQVGKCDPLSGPRSQGCQRPDAAGKRVDAIAKRVVTAIPPDSLRFQAVRESSRGFRGIGPPVAMGLERDRSDLDHDRQGAADRIRGG